MDFSALEKSIGYTFKDKNLLKNALTHTSYAYENKVDSNEKLECILSQRRLMGIRQSN